MAAVDITEETESAQIICIIGGPGVGKGTHCKRLAQDLDLVHVSVGDLLRAEARKSTADQEVILGAMKAGGLVPNERVQAVLDKHLVEHISQGNELFLLDGFPRSMEQATAFKRRGWKVKRVLHFDSSEEAMRTRMLRRAETENRVDDTIEIHAKRLRDFSEQGPQVIDFYEGEGVYQKVDCERDFEVVYQELPAMVKSIFGLPHAGAQAA